MRIIILITIQIVFVSLVNAGGINLSGWIRNDSIGLVQNNNYSFGNSLESRAIIQYRAQGWRIYSDLRVTLYKGDLYNEHKEMEFNLMRSFIRISTKCCEFTIGKTYINFGAPILYNPFEPINHFLSPIRQKQNPAKRLLV